MLTRSSVLLFGTRYRHQQVSIADRLGQEIDGALLHGADTRRNVALPGDENDRPMRAPGGQRLLQFEAVEARHGNVQYRAAGDRSVVLGEKLLGRSVCSNMVTLQAHES